MTDWIDSASRSLGPRFPEPLRKTRAPERASERLTALLLERLAPALAIRVLGLLPRERRPPGGPLVRSALAAADVSIGYPDFVERAALAIGEPGDEPFYREIADGFLCAAAAAWPDELAAEVLRALPSELSMRMRPTAAPRADGWLSA